MRVAELHHPDGTIVIFSAWWISALCQPFASFLKQRCRNGENDPDVVWIVEALAREAEDALFGHQPLHELEV